MEIIDLTKDEETVDLTKDDAFQLSHITRPKR